MPHDRDGNELKKGDRVLVPCVVKEVYTGEDACNVQLETEEPCHPGDFKNTVSCNAKQCYKDEGG